MSSYIIEFQDDTGVNAEVDLSDYVFSTFGHHMMNSFAGVRHMASRPRRPECRCRGLQTCIHCHVASLPEFQFEQPSRSKVSTFKAEADLNECSICQEQIKKGQMMCRLPCQNTVSHAFHRDCVMPWLDKNNTCPNCRSKI